MKIYKNNERGSAILLAILLLAFFMALTMSMYFLAQKKAESAGLKLMGTQELANVDLGTSLAYYEISLASELQKKGIMDREQDFDLTGAVPFTEVSNVTGDLKYDVTTPGGAGVVTLTLQAITINDYGDYFMRKLSGDYTRSNDIIDDIMYTSINDIRATGDLTENPTINYKREDWHTGMLEHNTMVWEGTTFEASIGGYILDSASVGGGPATLPIDITTLTLNTKIKTTLNKSVWINPDAGTIAGTETGDALKVKAIGEFDYLITVETESEVGEDGGVKFIEKSYIEDFLVEKQN